MDFNYDILLEYLSYKQTGSWNEFKKTIQNLNYTESLQIDRNKIRRMFSSLGHIEFMFENNNGIYSVCPSCISIFKNTYKGVLCGARTTEMLEKLQAECELFHLLYEEIPQTDAPKAIFIDFKNNENLENFIKNSQLNLFITKNFSERLLQSLPTLYDIFEQNKTEPVELNLKSKNMYMYETMLDAKLLLAAPRGYRDFYVYENRLPFKKEYFLAYEDKFYKIDRNYGLCISFAKYNKKILHLKNNNLLTPIWVPELIDRALTLASGFNREITSNGKKVIYANIDVDLANLTSQKMEIWNG